jgi:hypothetical protein
MPEDNRTKEVVEQAITQVFARQVPWTELQNIVNEIDSDVTPDETLQYMNDEYWWPGCTLD